MDKYYDLFEEIKLLNKKYEEEYLQNIKDSSFNIFQIERIDRKEVKMCRFLRALLDPKAGHGMGNEFLIAFAKDVLNTEKIMEKEISQNGKYQVICEEAIDENRRIDLIIKGSGFWIPIEAKIGAEDELNQCADYLKYAKSIIPNAKLYYLTIDGRAPSEKSVKGLSKEQKKDIIRISWKDIYKWADGCQKLLDGTNAELAFCFKQYKYAIKNFINNTEFEEKMIKKICKDTDTLKAANEVYRNYNKARTSIMKDFFAELKTKLHDTVNVIDSQNDLLEKEFVMNDNLEQYISNYYSKKTYPSITYPFKNDKIRGTLKHFIGNDYEFTIRIEVDESLFIGICVPHLKKEESAKDGETIIYINNGMPDNWEVLWKRIQSDVDDGRISLQLEKDKNKYIKNWWVAWQYIQLENSEKINFKSDIIKDNEDYFSLCDKNKMSQLVEICCKEFEKVYIYCKTLLDF